MKNKLSLLIIALVTSLQVTSQTYTLNLQKYWWYRYRLVNDFMKVGAGFGESIPSEQLKMKGARTGYTAPQLHWADGMQKQGNYLVLLATEHKLLSLAKLSRGRTNLELYYAINALNRLDSNSEEYYRHWNDPVPGGPASTNNHPIQDNIGVVPATTGSDVWVNDFNGNYVRDDVDEYFLFNNKKHFRRDGMCLQYRFDTTSSDLTLRNNKTENLLLWSSLYSTTRVPVEQSIDAVTELIKGLGLIIYLVPATETVTINSQVIGLKDLAKETLLRLVNYCSNPKTASMGSVLGWRNWQIINPVGKWCVYGTDAPGTNACGVGARSGANMSMHAEGAVGTLGKINAGWNSTQNSTISQLKYAPWHAAGYQLQKFLFIANKWTFPHTVDCGEDGMLFAVTLATFANNWRLLGGPNVTEYCVRGQSYSCDIHYPQLPLIYRVLHGGFMPRPENPFPWKYGPMPWHVLQAGNQPSYLSILNSAPPCGPYSFSGANPPPNPPYASWHWSSYDWVTEAKKRGGSENGIFPGTDYMSVFNLYCLNDGGYPKFYSNPYYRENLSQIYPFTNASGTFGNAANPVYLKYLQYLSTTSHITNQGRVTYRCGQQIELLPGFKADYGSNFHAFIKDYSCEDCNGLTPFSSAYVMGEPVDSPGTSVINYDAWTIDSTLDTVAFVPYDIPIDSEVQVEPTDSLILADSIDLWQQIMDSGDTEYINAVRQLAGLPPLGDGGGGGYRIGKKAMPPYNPIGFAIHPNPSNGSFTISMPTDEPFVVAVTDIYGKTIYQANFNGSRFNVHLQNAPPGNYMVRIISSHSIDVGKVVITK